MALGDFLDNILNKVFNIKPEQKASSGAPNVAQDIEPLNFTSSEIKKNDYDIYNLASEDIDALETIDYEQYVINQMQEEIDFAKEEFEIQDDKDGFINDIWNGFKELTGLGISKSEVANAIEKQEIALEQLKQAKINGNFEEVYEQITGNKYDEQKLIECHNTEVVLNTMQTDLDSILKSNDSDEVKQQKVNEYLINFQNSTDLSYKDLTNHYNEMSSEYLGTSNELTNVLNQYVASQENFIDKTANIAQIGGMGMMIIGGIACFIPGGQIIGAGMLKAGQMLAIAGTFGDNALEAVDLMTNDKSFEEESDEVKELTKETIIDGLLFATGYGAGSIAGKASQAVLKNTQVLQLAGKTGVKVLSQVTDKGLDIGLSLLGDAAITGEVDLQGEGLSQLLGVLTGCATAKIGKMNLDMPDMKVETPEVKSLDFKHTQEGSDFLPQLEKVDFSYDLPNIDAKKRLYSCESIDEILTIANSAEQEFALNLLLVAKEKGYGDFIESHPNIFGGMVEAGVDNVNGINYTKLSSEQWSVIEYIAKQVDSGAISQEVLYAVDRRISDAIPYGVFKYIDNLEAIPELGIPHQYAEGEYFDRDTCVRLLTTEALPLRAFLDTQSIPNEIKVTRSEGSKIFKNTTVDGKNLAKMMESTNPEDIQQVLNILNNNDIGIYYNNFVGTSLYSATEKINCPNISSAPEILWDLTVPKGSKGAFLEAMINDGSIYDECEFLLQTDTYFKINSAEYASGKFIIKADVLQAKQYAKAQDVNAKIEISQNAIEAGVKLGLVKTSVDGLIDEVSLKAFSETYDSAYYKKLAYIYENYPDLDVAISKKLISSFKTIEDMELHCDDIARWMDQDSELRKFVKQIEEAGIKDVDETKKRMAAILGVSADKVQARAKGFESIYDKITRKVLKGDKVSNLDEAKLKIGDLVGTRYILDDISQSEIDKLVKNLCDSIRAGDAVVTEIHNYSKNSKKYLSEKNIIDIREACVKAGIEVKILDTEQTSASGYAAAQMNIQYRDKITGKLGEKGELQIRGRLMDKYAEIEHILHDTRQGKNLGKNHPVLEEHFEPVNIAVNKLKRNGLDEVLDDYILECYQYINKYEHGEIEEEFMLPKFPETLKEYEILSFENLEKIDARAKEIKKKYDIR